MNLWICLKPSVLLASVPLLSSLSEAAIISRTYDLSSYSADQDGATLTGTISVSFDSEAGAGNGVVPLPSTDSDFLLLQNFVTSWTFTVNKPGQGSYTVSSTDAQASTSFVSPQVYSTPTTISLAGGSGLTLGIDTLVGSEQTIVSWSRDLEPDLYFSNFQGNVSPLGWDVENPQNIATDSNGAWIIGTAVPEPSIALLAGFGVLFLTRRRRAPRS